MFLNIHINTLIQGLILSKLFYIFTFFNACNLTDNIINTKYNQRKYLKYVIQCIFVEFSQIKFS